MACSELMGSAWLKAQCCRLEGSVEMTSDGWCMAVVEGSGSGCSW